MDKSKPKSLAKYCKKAQKLGAIDAKVISPKSVITAPWVRRKCQFGCGVYGQHLTCPPYSPTPDETRKILDSYKRAILVHGGEETDISDIAAKLEREIFLDGFYRAFGMGAGPCDLCSKCNIKGDCRYPEKARPSMEACGIDVYATARNNGFHIEVLRDSRCRGNYFGLILID